MMMAGLMVAGRGQLIVEFPNEVVTGADMEWNFVNLDDHTFFRLLLQAKQLYGDGARWSRHCYRELYHVTGVSGQLQAEVLCDTARAQRGSTYPLYIFYNPDRSCDLVQASGQGSLNGVGLADGYIIESLVKSAVSRASRTRNRALGTILPHMFELPLLFCPTVVSPSGPFMRVGRVGPDDFVFEQGRVLFGRPLLPRPIDIVTRLSEVLRTAKDPASHEGQADFDPTLSPRLAESIPSDVEAIIRRSRGEESSVSEGMLDRWRITFISTNPRDIEAEQREFIRSSS
jgi:hypothetical protein